jgi:hypothetical protein
MNVSIASLIDANIVNTLAGLATIVIAIFTIVYAWTTKAQLRVMSRQLGEMENQRKLYSQPVVVLKDITPCFEKPSIYSDPAGNNITFLSRFNIKFKIANIGNTPNVGGKVYAELFKNMSDTKSLLRREHHEIPYIEVGKPVESSVFLAESTELLEHVIEVKHLFNEKDCKTTISANKKMPYLIIKVAYKNITGAYFMSETKLRISDLSDNSTQAEAWYNSLKLAPATFQREIIEYNSQLKTDKISSETTFDRIKQAFGACLKYTDDLELDVSIDDIKFMIIDENEYNKLGAD